MNEHILNALTGFFPWILPECLLGICACVLFLGSTWKADRNLWGAVALIGVGIATLAHLLTSLPTFASVEAAQAALYSGPVWLDRLALYIKLLALAGAGILILLSWNEVGDDLAAEYNGCLLLIAAGVCFTGSANDLITLFLGLELISIPTYIILYLPRNSDAAQEAGAKYFLLSIFSSAMLLFGFSYLYGLTGTTNLQGIASAFTSPRETTEDIKSGLALVAMVMIVAGLGFKMTAVPFHFYAPDVYQGTSTGAAALLAFVPKVAGFVALIRVFGFVPFEIEGTPLKGGGIIEGRDLATLLWIIAAVTMTLGNLLALMQDNIKRMLAYSSVAHSGYMLVGLAAANYLKQSSLTGTVPRGTDTVLFYLVAYGAMTVGAFAVLEYLSTKQRPVETVDDLAGLSKSHPGVALVMALFLFSLIGLPPTPGFAGKWELLFGAFTLPRSDPEALKQANLFRVLALIMVINAAIGSWYYLRLITVMYLRVPLQPLAKQKPTPTLAAVGLCVLLTLVLFHPRPLFNRAREAINGKVNLAQPAPQVTDATAGQP